MIRLVVAIFLFAAVAAQECGQCNRLECPPLPFCSSGYAKDSCGCCDVCLKGLGETCDYAIEEGSPSVHGHCGEFLVCTRGKEVVQTGTCKCAVDGAVCGSDGVTYQTLCHLIEKTDETQELTVLERAPCRDGPVIKTPPKDSKRPLGSVLLLDCEAFGFPVPTVTWELNLEDGTTLKLPNDDSLVAVQVRGGPEKNMVTGWVQIMKLAPENVGIYTCIASNDKGETRASATVSVRPGKTGRKSG